MTCAVAEGIMDGGKESDFVHAMQEYGQGYPDSIFLCRYYFGGYGKKDFPAGHSGPEDYKMRSGRTLRRYTAMTFPGRWTRSVPRISSMKPVRETVPQALTAFFESTDFEDAIRNAISLGRGQRYPYGNHWKYCRGGLWLPGLDTGKGKIVSGRAAAGCAQPLGEVPGGKQHEITSS